jgi:hypothetical protein
MKKNKEEDFTMAKTGQRIEIKDLPQDSEISKEELRKVFGGRLVSSSSFNLNPWSSSRTFNPGKLSMK